MARRPHSLLSRLGVTAVLAVCGFMFVTSVQVSDGTDLRSEDSNLADLVRSQSSHADELNGRIAGLQRDVDQLTSRAAADDSDVGVWRTRSQSLEDPSGLRPVTGPGLTVVLNDAPKDRPQPDNVTVNDLVIHQQDVQSVVNALWAGGARAVSVENQRLISTSAIRCVGNTLRLNGRVYSPPYNIRAVGDRGAMTARLEESREIQIYLQYVDLVGLGWSVTGSQDLTIDAYEGALDLRFAQVRR